MTSQWRHKNSSYYARMSTAKMQDLRPNDAIVCVFGWFPIYNRKPHPPINLSAI